MLQNAIHRKAFVNIVRSKNATATKPSNSGRQTAKPKETKRLAQDAPTWMLMIRSSTTADVNLPMANIAFSIEKSKFSLQKITITFVFILNLS